VAIRYGFLGVSDVSPWITFAVRRHVPGAAGVSQWLFTNGLKLKP
jgi:hypothetical protein